MYDVLLPRNDSIDGTITVITLTAERTFAPELFV